MECIIHENNVLSDIKTPINYLSRLCYSLSKSAGWWTDLQTNEDLSGKKNVPELVALMHSELSESLEAHRKNLMDDKLPHRKGLEVELADCLIRIFDFGGSYGLDLGGAVAEKLLYNLSREDHKIENRRSENGKKF